MLKNSEKFPIPIGITCIPSSFPAKACKCSNDLYSGIKNNLSFLIWKTKAQRRENEHKVIYSTCEKRKTKKLSKEPVLPSVL